MLGTGKLLRSVARAALLTGSLLLLGTSGHIAHAQQFGKNKVQYRTFDWKYIQTDHFDIYFYDTAGINLAKFTAKVTEDALAELEDHWRYRITNRIPIIIYNSHNDFQQTNVVSEFLPEGVGGVTELFKNRVNVPFEGDWEKFRHVIHHELVHAVLNDKFYGGSIQSLISNNVRFMLPIWMNEGLAEFESQGGYDIETDMFIRDAVIGEYLPPLERLDGYMAYRGGQAFYWYVEQTYGREKIGELLNRCRAAGDLDAAFKGAFGKNVEEFSDQWAYDLKKIYWPDIANRKRPVDFALKLTDHKKEGSYFNTSPSLSPNGDKLAFISDRDDYRSVYVLDVNNPRKVRQVVQGEENVDFEELHLITPSIAWSPDSKKISLSVKSKGYDAIYIIDVESGSKERLRFDLDGIYSVDWSPDGTKLAFQGIKGDMSDIYTYDLASKQLVNVTNDLYSDMEPNWASDNRTIYFLSDRRDNPVGAASSSNFLIWNYDYKTRDIYTIDADTRELKRITSSDRIVETSPTPAPDGKLLYISDENGINNVYMLDGAGGRAHPLTNSISGIEQLSLTRDGNMLAFTSWNGDGQDIFLLRMPFSTRVDGDTLDRTTFLKREQALAGVADSQAQEKPAVAAVTPVEGYGTVKMDLADAAPTPNRNTSVVPGGSGVTGLDVPADARTASGDFAVKDYKVKFTADLIQASGNYSSFYGVQGVTQMLFSDMLGNHQIFIGTSLLLDLKNSDFLVSYAYLPERIDYGVDIFHSSRFFGVTDAEGNYNYTRFRQYGISGHASNPFDRFSRLDMALNLTNVSREPLTDSKLPYQSKLMLVPSASYVFDNSRMWAFNPVSGSRYYLTGMASPKLGSNGVGFYTLLGDFRHYIPLSKYGDYSIGARFSGGVSFGPNPQKFFVGGVDNWIGYEVKNNTLPIENAEDFTYVTPGYPLRGYLYNEEFGSKYFLSNVELRFPLFQALVSGPLPVLFQYVSGVMFVDAGSAWNSDFHFTRRNEGGVMVTDDLLLGTGFGARAYVFGMPVRLDVAWSYNLDTWSPPRYYFSLGYDF
jgi:Tol biopolymer transport system component